MSWLMYFCQRDGGVEGGGGWGRGAVVGRGGYEDAWTAVIPPSLSSPLFSLAGSSGARRHRLPQTSSPKSCVRATRAGMVSLMALYHYELVCLCDIVHVVDCTCEL